MPNKTITAADQAQPQFGVELSQIRPDAWVIQEGGPGPALFCLGGPTAWIFVAAGGLLAGVYNLLICDWIAEKV